MFQIWEYIAYFCLYISEILVTFISQAGYFISQPSFEGSYGSLKIYDHLLQVSLLVSPLNLIPFNMSLKFEKMRICLKSFFSLMSRSYRKGEKTRNVLRSLFSCSYYNLCLL